MRNIFVLVVIGVSFFDTLAQLPVVAPYARHLGATTLLAGFTVASYSLANMVGNLFAGPLIDRYGRKPSIIGGMLMASAGVFLASLALSPEQFVAARVVHGLGGAVLVPAAFTYLGDRASVAGGEGAPAMARSGIAIGVAALTGPPLAGILRDRVGFEAVFVGIAVLLAVTAVTAWLWLDERPRKVGRDAPVRRGFAAYLDLLGRPAYRGACLAVFGLMFGKGILAFALPLYAGALGYGAARVGLLLSGFAFSAILVFALTRRLGKVPLKTRVLGGLIIIAISLALIVRLEAYGALMGLMLFYGLGFGLIFASAAAQVVSATTAENRGRAFGLYYAIFSLGVVAGPVASGILEATAAVPPFLTGAAVVLAMVPVAWAAYHGS